MKTECGRSEKIPERIIRLAIQGDEAAICRILQYYDGYMVELARQTTEDEWGIVNSREDPYLKRLLETQLMTAILKFQFK